MVLLGPQAYMCFNHIRVQPLCLFHSSSPSKAIKIWGGAARVEFANANTLHDPPSHKHRAIFYGKNLDGGVWALLSKANTTFRFMVICLVGIRETCLSSLKKRQKVYYMFCAM